MRHIYKCSSCSRYTIKETCGCGSKTLPAKPIKYSPEDRLGHYRRKAKADFYRHRGLL